jgi:hypothetical protein
MVGINKATVCGFYRQILMKLVSSTIILKILPVEQRIIFLQNFKKISTLVAYTISEIIHQTPIANSLQVVGLGNLHKEYLCEA